MKDILNIVASRSQVLTKTLFKGYDVCINPYVGCEFGCKYCYVRFFVSDDKLAEKNNREAKDWGEFIRRREHIKEKLPKEIAKGFVKVANGKIKNEDGSKTTIYKEIKNEDVRLVLGTMTDPYTPTEKKHRITRAALEVLKDAGYNKIGIFTRSPIVLEDIELIKKLPRARIHYSITPYQRDVLHKLEPIPIRTDKRFKTITQIKEHGIRVHVNVAPAIPLFSDGLEVDFSKKLAEAEVDEFFVDPMQAYDRSFQTTKEALQDEKDWPKTEAIMTDNQKYSDWKEAFRKKWKKAWKKHGRRETLAIWCDHINHVWRNLLTDEELDPRSYND